jgi:hypothetical protein
VPPVARIDKIFDNKMGKLMAERERAAEAQELLQESRKDDESNATLVQNFLNEGLNIKEVGLCCSVWLQCGFCALKWLV